MQDAHFEAFFSNISGIYRAMQKLRAEVAEVAGVKTVHIFWIYLLREHPEGLIASELAEMSRTTRSLVSREIAELTDKNLVYADIRTARRRYAWRFYLTDEGRKLAALIDSAAMEVQTKVSRDISEEELEVFYRVLSRLSAGFDGMAGGR